jgi:hypothetical protein
MNSIQVREYFKGENPCITQMVQNMKACFHAAITLDNNIVVKTFNNNKEYITMYTPSGDLLAVARVTDKEFSSLVAIPGYEFELFRDMSAGRIPYSVSEAVVDVLDAEASW